jgi:hypothetical protein
LKRGWVFLFLILSGAGAQARVLDINAEKFATYFAVTGGPSALKQSAFLDEANPAYTYDKKVDYNYSGEFGLLYSVGKIGFRFGFEIFKPSTLSDVNASNGGATAYTFNSSYTAYAPKVGLEINLYKDSNSRAFIAGYAGAASVGVKNDYDTHSEEMKGNGTLYGGGAGYEGPLADNTTFVLEAGYRALKFEKLTYSKDVPSAITGGSHIAGDPVNDVNGQARTLNFGGMYLSVGFRFYL